ncbi:4Fe-4S binding protein [Candidatus Harpocratesius sp.]
MLVPLAVNANIGWIGYQGLVISPEFGPRMRLAAVLTSIENLPFTELKDNEHSWIGSRCEKCKACMRACPGTAILDPKPKEENRYRNYIEIDKCFPHFIENMAAVFA